MDSSCRRLFTKAYLQVLLRESGGLSSSEASAALVLLLRSSNLVARDRRVQDIRFIENDNVP